MWRLRITLPVVAIVLAGSAPAPAAALFAERQPTAPHASAPVAALIPVPRPAAAQTAPLLTAASGRSTPRPTAPGEVANRELIKAPPGFRASCSRYSWLCQNRAANREPISGARLLELAREINDRVNFSVTQLSDAENYGVAEFWSLPTNGNGDCEDFVLAKYKRLLDAGVDSRDLAVAVVLDRQGDNHAVLVLHHPAGDLVLDSLTSGVRPWNETGYRFLAVQVSADKMLWEVVADRSRNHLTLAMR